MSEIIQVQDHRRTFVNTLLELSSTDDKIVLLIPDVGFNYFTPETMPGRYFNTGVTEYCTMVMAAAMALSGLKPYVYSMIPFVTFRVHEMIRDGVICHKANVKILGVLGGPSYKMLGPSHNLLWPTEDLDMMSKFMECHTPQNNDEVRKTVISTYKSSHPAYIRL